MRLIDADALMISECHSCDGHCEVIECDCLNCPYPAECRCEIGRGIADAPTIDAVPVVRCGDCENWQRDWSSSGNKNHFCAMIDGFTSADFYCADGEKRSKNDG